MNPATQLWCTNLIAYFTMVATDVETKKAIPVNRLVPETELEHKRFEQGEENKKRRLQAAAQSLLNQPPTSEEGLIIHDLFMGFKKNSLANIVFMNDTKQESLILAQSQDRNIHKKIFGGFLMRMGFELAFSTAFIFAKTQPYFVSLDDVAFHKPVEIGSILSLKSHVIYTTEKSLLIEVTAEVIQPAAGDRQLTNVFYFTFNCYKATTAIPRVIPKTYEEAVKYLEGMRKYKRHEHPTAQQYNV